MLKKLFSRKKEAPKDSPIGAQTYTPAGKWKRKPAMPSRFKKFLAWANTAAFAGGDKGLTRKQRRTRPKPVKLKTGSYSNNPPGSRRKPPTMCESPDNQMTQLSNGRMVPQKRSLRGAA